MATKAETRPGVSKLDEQPKKITTDFALNDVSPDSEAAAFSFLPADLERMRQRREELGLSNDKERAQEESRKAELAAAERRLAALEGQVEAMRAAASSEPKGKKE